MFSWLRKKEKNSTQVEEKNSQIYNFDDLLAKDILKDIKDEFGLDYSKQEYITMRKIERFCIKNDIYSFSELYESIQQDSKLKEALLNMLTVGETYFYREVGHFHVLTQLMKQHHIKNILCAPSSSGEEAYSILLYLQEEFGSLPDVHITGIDINSEVIAKAKKACYSERSVSRLSEEILKKNFAYINTNYCLNATLKRNIIFKRQNIFERSSLVLLGRFDIVFCRNMLIYFDDKQKKEALQNIRMLLEDNGVLFMGHADISFEPDGFKKVQTPYGNYFQKLKM